MNKRSYALAAAVVLALSAPGMTPAFSQHSHAGGAISLQSMSLDEGRKWPTDDALRQGMSDIRTAVSAALPRIHAGQFTDRDYAALADRLQAQVDQIVATCKLPEDADAQLHLALTHVLEGAGLMRGAAQREQGAIAVVEALAAYGDHFEHPGWSPPAH
jgi:hypothetical protein